MNSIAGYIFSFFMFFLILFQMALAFGAPWGAASMGGKFPGKYPPKMRIVAVINIAVLMLIQAIVLSQSGLYFQSWQGHTNAALWVVVAYFGIAIVMNSITPSRIEKQIWAPVSAVLFAASLIVALNGRF